MWGYSMKLLNVTNTNNILDAYSPFIASITSSLSGVEGFTITDSKTTFFLNNLRLPYLKILNLKEPFLSFTQDQVINLNRANAVCYLNTIQPDKIININSSYTLIESDIDIKTSFLKTKINNTLIKPHIFYKPVKITTVKKSDLTLVLSYSDEKSKKLNNILAEQKEQTIIEVGTFNRLKNMGAIYIQNSPSIYQLINSAKTIICDNSNMSLSLLASCSRNAQAFKTKDNSILLANNLLVDIETSTQQSQDVSFQNVIKPLNLTKWVGKK